MKLLNFTIIKLTLCLIIGIMLNSWFHITLEQSAYATLILSALFFTIYVLNFKRKKKSIWFGFFSFITFITIGLLTSNLHEHKNFKNHYTHKLDVKEEQPVTLLLKVKKVLKPNAYNDKYIVNLIALESEKTVGKLLLNIKKDITSTPFRIDDELFVKSNLLALKAPLNPNQFNYKDYLEKQYVYHQIYTNSKEILKINSHKNTLFGFADGIRVQINAKLKAYNFKDDVLAIINALLLGQRQDISEETYNNYANAGAIHILAVSGLHVGIILLLLNFLLRPIERLKKGRIIKTILILILLWSFAIIAGLSASVTRAVTMFSVFAIALNYKRPTNSYNILAISMFILLLIKPMFLFDVGFQLSYLAVLAILWINPYLNKLWQPKLKVVNFFWQIFTVTIAAQIGIIPLSLFYFHQFPGLFFISNLVIIPFLGIILGLGILVIVLALLNILPSFIAQFYNYVIGYMNDFISWVAQQEAFLFKDISFSILHLIAFYILIISTFILLKSRSATKLIQVFVAVIVLQLTFIYNTNKNNKHEFIVFHKSRHTMLTERNATVIKVSSSLDSVSHTKDKMLKNYAVANFIDTIENTKLNNIYSLNGELLYVIDSLNVYKNLSFTPSYVLLRESPKLNLKRLINTIKPKVIIADGSNYKSYVNRWKATCEKEKLPFHYTGEKGALIIDLTK